MSSMFKSYERQLPAILRGGTPVVPPPPDSEVKWRVSKQGCEVSVNPLPQKRSVTTGRFDVGRDAKGRRGRFFAVRTAPVGLEIALRAVLIKRAHERGRAPLTAATAAMSAWSFPELFGSVRRVGLRPECADVNPDTGYPTDRALGAVADAHPDTELVALAVMGDHSPDLAAIGRMCAWRGLPFVLGIARMAPLLWHGRHAATYPDIAVVEGKSGARIVTFDSMLAAIVAKLCDAGRAPEPLPVWWPSEPVPDVPDTLPTAGAEAPVGKLVIPSTLDGDLTFKWGPRRQLNMLRRALAQNPELPWSMLPEQPGVDGGVHRAGLVFDPATSDKPEAWRTIGRDRAGLMLAYELTTGVGNGYPFPDELATDLDSDRFPNARYLSDHMHLVSPRFLLRGYTVLHGLAAMRKLHAWVDRPELQPDRRPHPRGRGRGRPRRR